MVALAFDLAFDVEKFRATLKEKGVIVGKSYLADSGGNCFRTINGRVQANKAYHIGYRDHINGRQPRYPENTDYMIGYNDYEPLIVVKRVGNKRPEYSLCDVEYHHELPEFYKTVSEALYYSQAGKDADRFCFRVSEWKRLNETFEDKVLKDSLIKPDVKRLYQSTIEGGLSTSIDGGKSWFFGGIMNYPAIPKITHRIEYRYSALSYKVEYITATACQEELLNGSLTKLKPPEPQPPKFDKRWWCDSPDSWWNDHIAASEKAKLLYAYHSFNSKDAEKIKRLEQQAQCFWNYEESEPTEYPNPAYNGRNDVERYFEIKEWRCDCYHAKVAEHEKAVKEYEKAIEKWNKL